MLFLMRGRVKNRERWFKFNTTILYRHTEPYTQPEGSCQMPFAARNGEKDGVEEV
jgi:hypothetical protein